jgi:hypothetical protein
MNEDVKKYVKTKTKDIVKKINYIFVRKIIYTCCQCYGSETGPNLFGIKSVKVLEIFTLKSSNSSSDSDFKIFQKFC